MREIVENTQCPAVDIWLERLSAYVSAAGGRPDSTEYRVDPERGAIFKGKQRISEAENAEGLVALADWYLSRDWAIQLCESYVVWHAAVLEHDGVASIIVGERGAGKSTLALALVKRGFRYLGDESAIVHPETLHVHPLPNALSIKDSVWDDLERQLPHFDVIRYPPRFRSQYPGAICGIPHKEILPSPGETFPVRAVFLLDPTPNESAPVPASSSVTATGLFNASGRCDQRLLRTATAVARDAQRWSIGRRNVDTMADFVEDVLRR